MPKSKENIAKELTYLAVNIGSPVVNHLTQDPKDRGFESFNMQLEGKKTKRIFYIVSIAIYPLPVPVRGFEPSIFRITS